MAYKKTNWQDTLRDAQGNVIQKGTPLNAQALGKIEDGIVAAEQKIDTEIGKVTTQLAQTEQEIHATNKTALNRANPLLINTFDGSFEPYHPSVKYFPEKWNGYSYWMAYTPFPAVSIIYKDRWECPSIAVSNDGVNWTIPNGLTNPLINLTQSEINNRDYFSDPSLVMNGSTMEIWYRKTNGANFSQTDTYRMTTLDGITWTAPEMVVDSIQTGKTMRSLQVFYETSKYRTYWCDGNNIAFWESNNPTSKIWTNYTVCNLTKKPNGFIPWHSGMSLVDGKYHLVIHDRGRETIEYFISSDGVNFEWQRTLLSKTINVPELYQAYPLKRERDWLLFSGLTKNNKHGIMAFRSDDLGVLEGLENQSVTSDYLVQGNMILGNSKNKNNPDQKVFVNKMESDGKIYGYGMNLQTNVPVWIEGDFANKKEFAFVAYGNKNLIQPTGLGQLLKDDTGGFYVSVSSSGQYKWAAVSASLGATTKTASTSVAKDGYDVLMFNPTTAVTVEVITGGSALEKLILVNNGSLSITLKHSLNINGFRTHDGADFELKGGRSVEMIAITYNGQVRWNLL